MLFFLSTFLSSNDSKTSRRASSLSHSRGPRCSVSEPFTYTTPTSIARKPSKKPGSRPDALLTFGLPKGSLQEATLDLFQRAGWAIKIPSRSYFPVLDDDELNAILLRAQELGRYTASGIVDAAITGYDWICENGVEQDVVEVGELNYSKVSDGSVRWVLAVPQDSDVRKPEDLEGSVVSTELMAMTKRYFEDRGVQNVRLEFSWGATEVKARGSFVDAIVDVTETGESLRANNLRVLDTVLRSSTRMIANRDAWNDPQKRKKIEDMYLLLHAALKVRNDCSYCVPLTQALTDRIMLPPRARSKWVLNLTFPEQACPRYWRFFRARRRPPSLL